MDAPLYSVVDNPTPALARHLGSEVARTARKVENDGRGYRISKGGQSMVCGGLLSMLKARFYPHHDASKAVRSRSEWKRAVGKNSSAEQGIRVDDDLAHYTAGRKTLDELDPMARAVATHLNDAGYMRHAAQVPVEIEFGRVTCADLITRRRVDGALCLYELKTGACVNRRQDHFVGEYADVACTTHNQWQLQLEYTRRSLVAAGVPIAQARVLQVYEKQPVKRTAGEKRKRKEKGQAAVEYVVKEHKPPKWLKKTKSSASAPL